MGPHQLLPFRIWVDVGITAMKKYFTRPRSPEQEPHHQMYFSVIPSPGDLGSIPRRVIPKTQKMVLDVSLLNTIRYGSRVKWSNPGKVLCFDLFTRPKMPFKVMHRKEVTHSNGSYERKSCGRKLADKMGRAKKFPWYTTEWCTGREWPVNCMTVISAWWRLNIRFQRSSGRRTII